MDNFSIDFFDLALRIPDIPHSVFIFDQHKVVQNKVKNVSKKV